MERSWSLFLAPEGGPEFICSDHPVALTRKCASTKTVLNVVGFKERGTEVFFPLSRRVGFYGVYEDPRPKIYNLSPHEVVRMNDKILKSAKRHVFSTKPKFLRICNGRIKEVNLDSLG